MSIILYVNLSMRDRSLKIVRTCPLHVEESFCVRKKWEKALRKKCIASLLLIFTVIYCV